VADLGRRSRKFTVRALLTVALWYAPAVQGQSATGRIEGQVVDGAGQALFGIAVTISTQSGAVERIIETGPNGRFQAGMLAPGTYRILAERLGLRPLLMTGVPVVAGRRTPVLLSPESSATAAERVDTIAYVGGPPRAGTARSTSVDRRSLVAAPWGARDLSDAARFASAMGADLSMPGNPGWATAIAVDGLSFRGSRHPAFGTGLTRFAAFPSDALSQVDVVEDWAEPAWPATFGGMVAATTRSGGGPFAMTGIVAGAGEVSGSSGSDADETGRSLDAALAIHGGSAGDSVTYLLGARIQRSEIGFAPVAELAGAAQEMVRDALVDRYGAEYGSFWLPGLRSDDAVVGFGRLDWTLSGGNALSARFNAARVDRDSDLPGRAGHPTIGRVEGTDLSAGMGFNARISDRVALNIQAAFEMASRDHVDADAAPAIARTEFAEAGVTIGSDPRYAGSFENRVLTARVASDFDLGGHRLQIGTLAEAANYEHTGLHTGSGEFRFSNASELEAGQGIFTRTSGPEQVSFPIRRLELYMQDRWQVTSALDLEAGVRLSRESLPLDRIDEDAEWLELSGLSNAGAEEPGGSFEPFFGFVWGPSAAGQVTIRGNAASRVGGVDPVLIANLLTDQGSARVQRWIGNVSGWPDGPAVGAGALPTLSLLGSQFKPPRTDRFGLGATVQSGHTTLDLSGSFSRTSGLPRPIDLNRLPTAAGQDQDLRLLYGSLRKVGAFVVAEPGANRRFAAYDRVAVWHSDGEARALAVTGALRHGSESASLFASYTFSRAEDDWPGAGLGGVERALYSQVIHSPDSPWEDGTSDLDIPHRVVIGGDLEMPGMPSLRLGASYRFRSGDPFTPGFLPGVDMNADGVPGNDPAFVGPDAVQLLASEWSCLDDLQGQFVERNSCREPAVHALDLRVSLRIARIAGGDAEVFVDGLNLIASREAVRDHALYLIDPDEPIDTSEPRGPRVPLVANSNFGEPLILLRRARAFRLGLQLRN
jgi:hypothetical protein